MSSLARKEQPVATWAARLVCGATLFGLVTPGLHAQYSKQYTPPPPPLTPAPCVPTKKDPCTVAPGDLPPAAAPANKFPYPGDAPAATAPAGSVADKFPYPGETPAPDAAKSAPAASGGTADKFPYPGESAGSGSSSSSSSSAGAPDTDAPAAKADPAGSPRSRRRPLPKVQNMNEREAEDLDVSHFYLQSGNFLGAYTRAKDAVKSIPDDPEAHFALALAAQKMKKPDEAVAEYNAYLKAEPGGDHVRAAQTALQQLQGR